MWKCILEVLAVLASLAKSPDTIMSIYGRGNSFCPNWKTWNFARPDLECNNKKTTKRYMYVAWRGGCCWIWGRQLYGDLVLEGSRSGSWQSAESMEHGYGELSTIPYLFFIYCIHRCRSRTQFPVFQFSGKNMFHSQNQLSLLRSIIK